MDGVVRVEEPQPAISGINQDEIQGHRQWEKDSNITDMARVKVFKCYRIKGYGLGFGVIV